MGRRNTFSNVPTTYAENERSSFGDSTLSSAITEISSLQQQAVTLMANYPVSRETTLKMLFRDDDLAKLEAVRGMVETRFSQQTYMIQDEVSITIDYEGAKVPAIEPGRLFIQPERTGPLREFIGAVGKVHNQYEELKGLLRWLNRNATPGAIRFYFPQAMKLVPDATMWQDLQAVPTRYSVPPYINQWMQLIRDAANTYAQIVLMPEDLVARTRIGRTMWLTFAQRRVELGENAHFMTDTVTYYA